MRWRALLASSFPSFAIVYLALFCAYGTESPFFPSFLASRGLSAPQVADLLATGTIVRLLIGPALGMLADALGARLVLAIAAILSGLLILLYLPRVTFWPLFAISLAHAAATTPLNPLADALALHAATAGRAFDYGWLRGIGSAGFIAGTLASGLWVARYGLEAIVVAASIFFLLMALPVPRLPPSERAPTASVRGAIPLLLRDPSFRVVLIVSGLVIGSHAMNDTFAVIQWQAAGIPAGAIGLLWSGSVASEVLTFVGLGPVLLARLDVHRCAMIGAIAGVLRWGALAMSDNIVVLAGTQLLHGLTFSLVHLACMQVIGRRVPGHLAATAQMLYGTVCLGLVIAALTFLSGEAYQRFGAHGFWFMSALCVAALPFARTMGAGPAARTVSA